MLNLFIPASSLLTSGTFGNGIGLSDIAQCADVQPGFYSPTGSALPLPCPSWGFCPGRAYDTENPDLGLEPGSQPVVVPGGQQVVQQVVQQSVVEQEVELLASDSAAVNKTVFLQHMASQYGVPIEAISLELTEQEQDRQELSCRGTATFSA